LDYEKSFLGFVYDKVSVEFLDFFLGGGEAWGTLKGILEILDSRKKLQIAQKELKSA
jgi:hypothetical protein